MGFKFVVDVTDHQNRLEFTKSEDHQEDSSKEISAINNIKLPVPFTNITSILLTNCGLKEFPNLLALTNLIELNISRNKIKIIPKSFLYGNLKLEKLDFSHNLIEEIDKPKFFKYIRHLDLSSNCLKNVPVWIFNYFCVEINYLDLSRNPFKSRLIFMSGRCLRNLNTLKLNNCMFRSSFLGLINTIPNLETIQLSNDYYESHLNTISQIPVDTFSSVTNLREINFSGLGLLAIDGICSCINLEILNLGNNLLSQLPQSITNLKKLRYLNLTHNELMYIIDDINELYNLTDLNISSNIIFHLPENIQKCTQLRHLDCYNNDIFTDLTNILKLPNLQELDLEQNTFETDRKNPDYLNKLNKLREHNRVRVTGAKQTYIEPSDDDSNDDRKFDSDCDDDDDYEEKEEMRVVECDSVGFNSNPPEEEDWDQQTNEDDYLSLPKFQLRLQPITVKNIARFGDISIFEDSPDDK